MSITETKVNLLNGNDRCDGCGAQAYVWVKGVSGELLFCGHHYNKIMSNEKGRESLTSFAFEVIDERP
jgi:hypothetical protein